MYEFQNDQAAGLRCIMGGAKPRVMSIISTSAHDNQPRLLTNLAASIRCHDVEVLVVHAAQESYEATSEYEMKGIHTLLDVAQQKSSLQDALRSTSKGFAVAKLYKNQNHAAWDIKSHHRLEQIFCTLANRYEIVLVDTALNRQNSLPLKKLNDSEIVIQLTRNPESIKQAYRLIKRICQQLGNRPFGILVADATETQAQIVFRNIAQVARRYLHIELVLMGAIPSDEHLGRAAKLGRTVIDAFPMAMASNAFKTLAKRLDCKQSWPSKVGQASFV